MFPNRKFGELMIERSLIDKHQLSKALKQQQTTGRRIGSILVDNGDISEEQLENFLAFYYDVPKIDLTGTPISATTLRLLDREFIGNTGVIPFRVIEDAAGRKTLMLAMIDPTDDSAIAKAEEMTHMEVEPFVITHRIFLDKFKSLPEESPTDGSLFKDCETRDLLIALIDALADQGILSREELQRLIDKRNMRQ